MDDIYKAFKRLMSVAKDTLLTEKGMLKKEFSRDELLVLSGSLDMIRNELTVLMKNCD